MATQAVIVSITEKAARIAYYYPVPEGRRITAAADATREPVNGGLSPPELQALKDGELHEFVYVVPIGGLDQPEARAKVEAHYAVLETTALTDYERRYKQAALVGRAWDGTSWS